MTIVKYFRVCCLGLFIAIFAARAADQQAQLDQSTGVRIKNPFYQTPKWKIWRSDDRPVTIGPVTLSPPPASSRLYPIDVDKRDLGQGFLTFHSGDWPGRRYAGMWDDVYASLDNRHSYIPKQWRDESGNEVQLSNQHMHLVYPLVRDPRLLQALGLNFTSQSTQGMGHDLTDSFEDIDHLERDFCFANILRAGPAHASYGDLQLATTLDKYDAIMPCFFNSVGSSSSEVNALAKMLITGAHLPIKTKLTLKQNGLYIPTLLYLWKANLPYDVPYTNELRHRVAYASTGTSTDRLIETMAPLNQSYHRYDDSAHLRNMISMAKAMDVAPPIALLRKLEIKGGVEKSINRTTMRVYQKRGKAVHMRISAADSFDLQGRKLTYRWTVLYENTPVTIKTIDGGREALVTVRFDRKLPKGRTVVLLTVNNGRYDSNPAVINVYRPFGADNLRPSLTGLSDRTVLSGELIRFDIGTSDPDGFPSKLYRWSNEVGTLNGNRFTWRTPNASTVIQKRIHLISADGLGSYNSAQATLTVTPTLAVIDTDRSEGDAPFTVRLSASQSRDRDGNLLNYSWDLDDGSTATGANVNHTFTEPGFYKIGLTVSGPLGSHIAHYIIHVRHRWPKVLNDGWRSTTLKSNVWRIIGPGDTISIFTGKALPVLRIFDKSKTVKELTGVESIQHFNVPLYLETSFIRLQAKTATGFEIFGKLIGRSGGIKYDDTSIAHQQPNGQWVRHYIGPHLRSDPLKTGLQLFVNKDPKHDGRIRYAGYLESKLGRYFFRLDNQPRRDNRLRIITRGRSGPFDIKSFKVWAPAQ